MSANHNCFVVGTCFSEQCQRLLPSVLSLPEAQLSPAHFTGRLFLFPPTSSPEGQAKVQVKYIKRHSDLHPDTRQTSLYSPFMTADFMIKEDHLTGIGACNPRIGSERKFFHISVLLYTTFTPVRFGKQ